MMFEAATIADLPSVIGSTAFLVEDGKEGAWIVKDKTPHHTELLAVDLHNGIICQHNDPEKVVVRQFNGAISASWWGFKEGVNGVTAASLLQEALNVAKVHTTKTVEISSGEFNLGSNVTIPVNVKLLGQGTSGGEEIHKGATVINLTSTSSGFQPLDYSFIGGLTFIAATGIQPSIAINVGGRGVNVGVNGYFGPIQICIEVGSFVDRNLQMPIIDGGFGSGFKDGVRIRQYRQIPAYNVYPYASNSTMQAGRDYVSDKEAWRCTSTHTSPSGSFESCRSSNPGKWQPSYHLFGGADENSGYLGPCDFRDYSGVAFGFYNAAGWTIDNPKAQKGRPGSIAAVFDKQSRGNKGMMYIEGDNTAVYVGEFCHTNEIDLCTLVEGLSVQYGPGAKANNTMRQLVTESDGRKSWRVA